MTIATYVSERNKQTVETVARQSSACAFSEQRVADRKLPSPRLSHRQRAGKEGWQCAEGTRVSLHFLSFTHF